MTEGQTDGTPTDGTESHDPDFPEAFLAFMRQGWRDTAARRDAPRRRRPTTPSAGPRSPRPSPARRWSSPPAREKVRANDTDYPFRPGSDFA